MISAVVVSLALVASTIALPLTTQQHSTINETPQIHSGIPLTVLPQQIEKTGVETSEFYTQATQTVQSEQYTNLNTHQQQVGKTGYQTPSEVQSQKNSLVPKVENVPVNVEEVQLVNPQNPILLPVRPLSVVPYNPSGQVLRPVVVPAEAIADGRVIITPIGSIQQRSFPQDVFLTQENQVLHQQVIQPTTYTAVQTQGTVEKQTSVQQEIQPSSQVHTPVYSNQETFNREQQVPGANVVKHTAESLQNVNQVQQKVQSESAKKQTTVKVLDQVDSNPQQQQVYNVQEASEKQGSPQQTQIYPGIPVVVENTEKYQKLTGSQIQNVKPSHQQQVYNPQKNVEKQAESPQVVGYSSVQNVQVENFADKTEKQGQYQESYIQSKGQLQTVEEQALQQQQVQSVNYVPVQQEVYSVVPEENQVPYLQQQNVENFSGQIVKTSEVEPDQKVANAQPQQVAGEPVYNFGDKLSQVNYVPVHSLSSVPQKNSVQPSVTSTQE